MPRHRCLHRLLLFLKGSLLSFTLIDKLREAVILRDELGLNYDIEVDGGVNFDNIRDIHEAGANIIVAGSTVFKGNAADNVKKLIELM